MKSLTFNGIKKPWLYQLSGRNKPPFASVRRNLLTVSGMPGAHLQSSNVQPLPINQPVFFEVIDDAHALQLKDELASWLITDEPAELQFDDEPGRIYYAIVQNTLNDFDRFAELRQGTIQFLCLDPYAYGPEKPHQFTDATILTNEGTAEAQPIFELEVLAPVTFAMVSNGDEYNLLGIPTAVDEEVVDTKTLLLEERGQSLDTWETAGTNVDGTVAGTLGTDNDGITVPSYGADTITGWHGPALMKEVVPAQDFEIVIGLQGRTTETAQTFRIEVYLFDEGMNELGKMALLDNSPNVHTKVGEARLGNKASGQYLISSRNYEQRTSFWFGMVRMRRIGNKFEFYITRINNHQKHVESLLETYVDNTNAFMGKLKYVQIHIGKYGDTPRAYAPKINYIQAYELKKETIDQTPYIARPGDIITFDHKEDELLINGEDRKELKDFGGSFFSLSKGENQLAVLPSGAFDAKVKYRPRYR